MEKKSITSINLVASFNKIVQEKKGEISKKDLINLYNYINEVTKKENHSLSQNNFEQIKQKISECKSKNISDLLITEFNQDGWNVKSSDNSSLLTIAIERIEEKKHEKDKGGDYDIHIRNIVFLIFHMEKELITGLENFADSKKKTLLHYLAGLDREDLLNSTIQKLRSSGSNIKEEINKKDKEGKTPLHYAAERGCIKCFQLLIGNDADFTVTINHKSELHYAARSGSYEFLEYLKEIFVQRGIYAREKSKRDEYENNALHYAAQSGDERCIKFLIDNYVQFITNKYKKNPLHKIANIKASENAINHLIENLKSSDRMMEAINQSDVNSNTPLHIAA